MCVHVGDRGQPDILPFHHGSPEAQWKTPLTAGPSSITPPTLPYSGSQSPALGGWHFRLSPWEASLHWWSGAAKHLCLA